MQNYKNTYETRFKSQSIKNAQKILRKKIRFESKIKQKQNLLGQNNSNQPNQIQQKQSSLKIRNRSASVNLYSSFCRNNFQIADFNKLKKAMRSNTEHYKHAILIKQKQKPPEIRVNDQNVIHRLSLSQFQKVLPKPAAQRVKTEGKDELKINLNQVTAKKKFQGLKLISNPKKRNSSMLRTQYTEKGNQQNVHQYVHQQSSPEKYNNFYLQKEISKKISYSDNLEKTYRFMFPMIKEKKIHLR